MARPNRRLALCALAASIAIALTGMAAAESLPVRSPEFQFGVDFSPKQVSKRKPTPITFSMSWRAERPMVEAPLRQLVVETDRHLKLDVRGLPSCAATHPFRTMPARCKDALVGKGSVFALLFYPESSPAPLDLKLEIFKGVKHNGMITLLVYAPVTFPTPGAFLATIELRKVDDGRYGTEAIVSFPASVGGSKRVVVEKFEATIDRRFTFKGTARSAASLSCPDGKVQVHTDALLADGSLESEDAAVPCSATR
jgi:hypothetical protein